MSEVVYRLALNGWIEGAKIVPSPNFNERPTMEISLLVIHCISLPEASYGGSAVEDFFQNKLDTSIHPNLESLRGVEVSAHFFIRRDGELVQFVSIFDRAWHAGVSEFDGRAGCNDFSVGVELEGTDRDHYTEAQYETLVRLTKILQEKFVAIDTGRIVGHEHIAPGRKTDPGTGFDWDYYFSCLDA